MSYGIIRAWKGASKCERVECFIEALIESDKEYLLKNCSTDIEFIDVVDNCMIKGIESLTSHSKTKWNLPKGSFNITKMEISFADKNETASFALNVGNKEAVGLLMIEESNGRLSNCKLALVNPK